MSSTIASHDHRSRARATAGGYLLGGLGGLAGLAGASVAACQLAPALSLYWPGLRRRLGVECHTAADAGGYALTFDDGPHPQGTPAMLEILAAADVPATFFLVGEQVRRNPSLVEEILAGGHRVGLHCDRHRNLLRLTPRQARDDILRARETIGEAMIGKAMIGEVIAAGGDDGGEEVAGIELYRPPYGALSASALRVARANGWRTLLWSQWGRDWRARATAESIAAELTSGARAGSVLLLHDADDYSAPGSWRRTAAALPRVLDTLAARGLQPVFP